MSNLTNKELEDYLVGLPTNILIALQDRTWSKRTEEISVKYSLTEEQANILKNLVMFVLIAVESPNTLEQSIETELGISNLLSEQIVKEIDDRVFGYVFNKISETKDAETEVETLEIPTFDIPEETLTPKNIDVVDKSSNTENQTEEAKKIPEKEVHTDFDVVRSMSKDIEYIKNGQDPVMHNMTDKKPEKEEKRVENQVAEKAVSIPENEVQSKIPEIRPDMTPSAEPTLKNLLDKIPHNLPGVEIKTPETDIVHEINDLGDDKIFVGSEFIKESETQKENAPQSTEQKQELLKWGSNINDGSNSQTKQEVVPENEIKISVPKYTADPYREPIE